MLQFVIITSSKFQGHTDLHKKYLGDRALIVDDYYGGSDYPSNEPKLLSGIVLASAPWSVHMDHDTYINPTKVEKFIESADPNCVHAIVNNGIWPPDRTLNYPSGACMIMHETVRRQLIPHLFFNQHTGFSDVTLGFILRKLGVQIVQDIPVYIHYVLTTEFLSRLYS